MNKQLFMFGEPAAVVLPAIKLRPRRERAEAARDRGIKTAAEHADAVDTQWTEVAFMHLKAFVLPLAYGAKLTCEQVRERAEKQGFRAPPTKRAWGNVMLAGARAGLIRKVGFTTAEDPKVHCNPISQWIKT